MAVGRGGSSVQTKLGFLLYGEQGTRKSSFALEFMKMKREDGKPFRVLYIDAEFGSIDSYLELYENDGYSLNNIYIMYTQSLTEVKNILQKVKNGEDFYEFDENGEETDSVYLDEDGEPFRPDAVVVDGVTVLYIARQQGMIEFSKKRATVRAKVDEKVGLEREVAIDGAGMELKDYNTLKFNGQDLILDLIACGKHFAATCREQDEKEQYKDKNGEIKMMATGRKEPSGFKDIRYNVKTVLRMFNDDDGITKAIVEEKDRSMVKKQNELLIEPTMTDWQVAIDRNKNKQNYKYTNNLTSSVNREVAAIESESDKYEDDIKKIQEASTEKTLNTAKDYHDAIKQVISSLKPVDRSKKQMMIAQANLPNTYQKIDDVELLKQYLDILKK